VKISAALIFGGQSPAAENSLFSAVGSQAAESKLFSAAGPWPPKINIYFWLFFGGKRPQKIIVAAEVYLYLYYIKALVLMVVLRSFYKEPLVFLQNQPTVTDHISSGTVAMYEY
jgi:hypothetical protein